MTTDDTRTVPVFRVSPYRFTAEPERMRDFLEAVGLCPVIGRSGFTVLRGAGGLVAIHPLATAESTDHVATSFCLETDDARAAAEALEAAGMSARWWDEAWGRQAAVRGPLGEITINEPMYDTYGYDPVAAAETAEPSDVEVTKLLFSPDLDAWSAFFARLGFAGAPDDGYREARAGADSGAIGLHVADAAPEPSDASALAFTVAEPLADFAARMRALGHRVDEIPVEELPDAGDPYVELTDPDGERIEVRSRR